MECEYKTTSKLTEREKKQAALPILVYGNDLVEKFYSKHYCDKEDGLNRLKEQLLSYDNSKIHTPNKTARAAIFLLHRALRDKVFSVYNLANEVIRLFFVQFIPGRCCKNTHLLFHVIFSSVSQQLVIFKLSFSYFIINNFSQGFFEHEYFLDIKFEKR